MITRSTLLGLMVVGLAGAGAGRAETVADQITLRDGSVVKGLVTSVTTGPRGSVEFLVRRAWAEKTLTQHLQTWDHSTAAATRLALGQRRKRLELWRRERAPGVGPDDRIIAWIDHELRDCPRPGRPSRRSWSRYDCPAMRCAEWTDDRRRSNGSFASAGCAIWPSPSRWRSTT